MARNCEVREMRTAETVLSIIRERGRRGLPLGNRSLESHVTRKSVTRGSEGGRWKSAGYPQDAW
jgi:hypothetical protein